MFIFNYGSVWFLILFEISIDLRTLEYTSSSSWVISQKSILNFVGYFWMHKTITESGLFDDNKVLSEQLACCLIEWNFRENYCLGCMWTERYLHFFPFYRRGLGFPLRFFLRLHWLNDCSNCYQRVLRHILWPNQTQRRSDVMHIY